MVIPADTFQVGTKILVIAGGIYGSHSTAPVLTIRIKLGSVILGTITGTLPVSMSARAWELRFVVKCVSIGATGTFQVYIGTLDLQTAANAGTTAGIHWFAAATVSPAVNTTIDQTLSVTVQWGASNANNTITCHGLSADIIEAGAAA
jgi:hypothetical protein